MDRGGEPHTLHRTEGSCCNRHPAAPELPDRWGLLSEPDPLGAVPHVPRAAAATTGVHSSGTHPSTAWGAGGLGNLLEKKTQNWI